MKISTNARRAGLYVWGAFCAIAASKLAAMLLVKMAHGETPPATGWAFAFALVVIWTRYGVYIERVRTEKYPGLPGENEPY